MNKSLRHYSEWKKPDTKENPLFYSIYVMFKDRRKQSVIIQCIAMAVSGGGEGLIGEKQGKTFWKVKNVFLFHHISDTRLHEYM